MVSGSMAEMSLNHPIWVENNKKLKDYLIILQVQKLQAEMNLYACFLLSNIVEYKNAKGNKS